jgi:DNA-binding transcriptional LysR family regulator
VWQWSDGIRIHRRHTPAALPRAALQWTKRLATTMETQRLRRYLRHGMLPQLAAFDAVMRLGSVTRASEALHMAQPTVSGHLRKLADAVGVPLFRCDGRCMQPTSAARALHEGALGVFAALHDLECAVAPLRAMPQLQSVRTPPDAATLRRTRLDGLRPQASDGQAMHTSKETT